MSRKYFVILLFFIGFVAGLQLITGPLSFDKVVPSPTPTPVTPKDVPIDLTIEGEYTCLLHKNTSGPQTLECALGLKRDDGTYVALDLGELLHTDTDMKFATGNRLRVKGLFVPIEQISSGQWQKYNASGIMKADEVTKL